MTKNKSLLLLWPLILLLLLFGCKDDMTKYQRPDWLAGKVYSQVLAQPELSTFATCIQLTGYDKILDVSGSYTIFAPSDEAFKDYFASNSKYNSVEAIPLPELEKIVKYHIVQNPWSKIQLRTLDVYGWIDTLDLNNNQPKGFKRETLLKEKDLKYGIESYGIGKNNKPVIVDTLTTNWYRRVVTESRKYVPFFYQEYFSIYDLKKSDYEFYFNRTFDSAGDIYFAGAKITSDEIPAENGFVYIVDKVVEPLKSAYEILGDKEGANNYSDFFNVVNLFPDFEYNQEATLDQPGADLGLEVDSLFDLTFPDLAFDLNSERTSPPRGTYGLPSNVTIRYHHGLMAPTNQAFQSFIDEYIKIPNGWGTFNGTPDVIKRIVVNTYLSENTIYPTDFEKGFYNGEQDIVQLDENDIVQHEFGSNSTFIGLSKAVVPRAFKSITGPVYLQRGYNKIMLAIERADLLPALKRPNKNYTFFIESDANTSADSSFIYKSNTESFSAYQVFPGGFQEFPIGVSDLRTLLLNHVGTSLPTGIPRKEFISNLAGNYIVINNKTGEYSGTGQTTIGYKGSTVAREYNPRVLSDATDNGITYDIKNWFSFSSPTLFTKISSDFPKFHALMNKAGLTNNKEYKYTFVSDNEFYTVLIPTDAALDSAKVNTMTVEQLKTFLQFHFIQGEMIFTDGKQPDQYYETARIDERSTPYTTVYSKLFLKPVIDIIQVPDKNGEIYTSIEESDETTNFMTGINVGTGQEVYPVLYVNAVIHRIDKALIFEKLDTN
ncbi:MAG: fasciclin domain-containing protein [Draconibacterium sp.]